ncbi:MAG: hypothetical protein KDK01_14640 [Rhodobacteraceae bacterium]|nr:hypothetical protein [Paracoccaceae bacterium]
MMDALFLAELNERLFVQFSQGRWRAPLGQRLLPVRRFDGDRMGRIVCAESADLDRALLGLGQGQGVDREALWAAWEGLCDTARALRAVEGFDDRTQDTPAEPVLAEAGPMILLSAADAPLAGLVAVLIAGAEHGVLWKPAPGAAASAHLVMRALGPLAVGNLALVQGDHATGAALAGLGPLVWASAGAVPKALCAPLVSLSARAPRRR